MSVPNNLILTASKDDNRDEALMKLLKSDKLKDCSSIIVYCTKREDCERVAVLIRIFLQYSLQPNGATKRKALSLIAEPYHAGLTPARRKYVQKNFMSGNLRIVVATVAFGMGINKRDIRAVIHFNMPRSFESYVQEIGRAGRDEKISYCHIFMDQHLGDFYELKRHVYANSVDRFGIRKLLQIILKPCRCHLNLKM